MSETISFADLVGKPLIAAKPIKLYNHTKVTAKVVKVVPAGGRIGVYERMFVDFSSGKIVPRVWLIFLRNGKRVAFILEPKSNQISFAAAKKAAPNAITWEKQKEQSQSKYNKSPITAAKETVSKVSKAAGSKLIPYAIAAIFVFAIIKNQN